jgi:hypothetical protein
MHYHLFCYRYAVDYNVFTYVHAEERLLRNKAAEMLDDEEFLIMFRYSLLFR